MKKLSLLTLMITILMFSTNVFAVSSLEYSVEEAQKVAIENSRQAIIDDLDIKLKQTHLDNVKTKPSSVRLTGDLLSMLEYRKSKEIDPMQAQLDLDISKRIKQDHLNALKLDVFNTSLDIALAQKQRDMELQKLDIIKKNYESVYSKYKINTVSLNDLNDAQYQLDSKNDDLSKIGDKLNSLSLKFKNLLNLKLDDIKVTITDDLKADYYGLYNLDKILKAATEDNTDIYNKNESYNIKKKILDLAGEYFKAGDEIYDEYEIDIGSVLLSLSNSKILYEVNLRNKYNDLLNQWDDISITDKYLQLMDKKLKSAEIKYKNGILSQLQYLSEKGNYLDALYQKYVAIHDFNVTKAEFNNIISQ